jgi:hypothetical protein
VQYIADQQTIQRRLAQHKSRISLLYLLLAGFTFLICVSSFIGRFLPQCVVPALILVGLGIVAQAISVQVAAPRRIISTALVDQQLEWLFGEDWQNSTSSVVYAFAEDRVRQRQVWRAIFPVHLLMYAAFYGTLVMLFGVSQVLGGGLLIIFGAITLPWLAFLALHAWVAFPTKNMLQSRERAAAREKEQQLRANQPRVARVDQTLEAGAHYAISDDGELVKVTDTKEQPRQEKNGAR